MYLKTKTEGPIEELVDKMPYIIMIGVGLMLIITLAYIVYDYSKRKDKKSLFLHFTYGINIIFVGFVAFAVWSLVQLEPGENLGMEQEISLLVVIIGIVVFNVLIYLKGIRNDKK